MGHRGSTKDDSAEIFLQSFLRDVTMSSSGMDRDFNSVAIVNPAFPLPTAELPTLPLPWRAVVARHLQSVINEEV